MGHKLGLSSLAVCAVAVLVATAFASPGGESRRGGTLRLMWATGPTSLDPARGGTGRGAGVLVNATCAKLIRTVRDPDSGSQRVVREVVRSTTVSNDRRTYTFELKRTFRFHTGAPVTARSFAAAIHRTANPLLGSPVVRAGYLQEIVGADAATRGQTNTISGVQALGRYRLRIRLNRPVGDFIARLTMPYFCPILPGTPNQPIDRPPGSGPYYISEHDPNRRIVLERNPFYGGEREANPNRIEWTIEPRADERLRATQRGENDFLPLFSQPDQVVRDLVAEHGLNRPAGHVLRDTRTSSTFGFVFNLDRPAFGGRRQAPVGKAINYILDRPALAAAHQYLTVSPTDRLLPAALSRRRALYPRGRPDPVLARRWLARAGRRPQTLNLYMWDFPFFGVRVAQLFTSSLRLLDIDVNVTYLALDELERKVDVRGEPWDVAWLPFGAAYPDPASALAPLLRGTRHEARLNAANRLTGAARARALVDLELDLMRDDPPVAAYAHFTPLALVSRRNFGCWSGADAHLDLATVCKK